MSRINHRQQFDRTMRIPTPHLLSEVVVFPLASEAAFELAITELDPLLATGHLDRDFGTTAISAGTSELWQRARQRFLTGVPSLSIDELIGLRDRFWFRDALQEVSATGAQPAFVTMTRLLRQIATGFLRIRSAGAVPCLAEFGEDEDELASPAASKARSRMFWRWLTLAMPPDTLSAAAGWNADWLPDSVEMLAPQLREMLARNGFAEPHLHLGAAVSFPNLWISTQLSVLSGRATLGEFASPDAIFRGGRDFGRWILRATLARYLLSAFLTERHPVRSTCGETDDSEDFNARQTPFQEWLLAIVESATRSDSGVCSGLNSELTTSDWLRIVNSLGELSSGTLPAHSATTADADLRLIAARLLQVADRVARIDRADRGAPVSQDVISQILAGLSSNSPERASPLDPLQAMVGADPLCDLFGGSSNSETQTEGRFIAAGLKYLESDAGASDRAFASLFWQSTRIRCLFYRYIVQRPLTAGLQWFIRTYARISPGRRLISPKARAVGAWQLSGGTMGLKTLEVRTSPAESVSQTKQLIEAIADGFEVARARGQTEASLAIVIHFSRERRAGDTDGAPPACWLNSHADPGAAIKGFQSRPQAAVTNPTGFRYAAYFAQKQRETDALSRYLEIHPGQLSLIRGIDLCTDELGVPHWVHWPLFRQLRDRSAECAAITLASTGIRLDPLRTTIHTGEDWIHLQTGLRSIDESIRYLRLREGDRLGHCMALGIDAEKWARSAGRMTIASEQRLFDLVWEWTCYSRFGVPATVSRKSAVDLQLHKLSSRLFDKAVSPPELASFVDQLHNEATLGRLGFPDGRYWFPPGDSQDRHAGDNEPSPDVVKLVELYLTERRVFLRGREPIWLDPSSDAQSLDHLQRHLRHRISTLGLTVEINPSSNLLIGNLTDLSDHPFWRLASPFPDPANPPLPVVIGSDDPITFATNLPDEFQLVHDSLVLGGLTFAEAQTWIDNVRETSLKCRFSGQ